MAAPVNATINVLANTDQAVAQFRSLQAQVASLNKTVSATSGAAAAQQAALAKALQDGANASRMWNARIVPMNTAVSQFSEALDKGRMSLGQYTRYAASQLPGMSRVFRREFDMMTRVAETNVKRMQTQYIALNNSATNAAQAMAFTPAALDKYASSAAIASQRQMMMNRMIDLGTTKLLNWGKNTQWAGRQLMVGFSIPLAMMGAAAAKAFKEIDQGTISFKRVYGDLQTTTAEMERNLDAVKELGMQYTQYGKSLASTIDLAADVAATGARNESLIAATEQTIRLATLGLMEYDEALQATVALQTAFQISNEDLAGTIDFLNVVENETILTMQDMAAAIPRVAPVIKGLGGDVKDLAVFMTALREGGVTAEQGANALKSGLGRLINPTRAAREEAEKYGISIDAIVQRNRGDLMGTVTEFGEAISRLNQLQQQQVLQKVFGTYQYARLGALFRNLSNDAGQAQRTMELTSMSVEDLAKISERELSKIQEATSVKFQAAVEQLKVAIAPIGETFMKALMPVLDFVSKLLNSFNDLPDNVKNVVAITIGAIAGIGPIVLMTVGLIANGIANIGKLIQTMRKFFARLRGDASLFNYLTVEEQEAAAAANNLGVATDNLTGKFLGQQKALERLIGLVGTYSQALGSAAAAMPLGMGIGAMPGGKTTSKGTVITGPRTGGTIVTGPGGIRMAKGGIVPGTGNRDSVPAMLTPGESVVTKKATQQYGPMIQAMNAGTVKMLQEGALDVQTRQQPQSYSTRLVFAHGQEPIELTKDQLDFLKSISSAKAVRGATRGQGLSNFGFVTPEAFNMGQLTGPDAAKLFSDPKLVDRTMYPMYSAIARQIGNVTPEQVMAMPGVQKDVRGFAANIAAGLVSQTGKIKDIPFYETVEKALSETQMSASSRAGIMASKQSTTVALYGDPGNQDIRSKGERLALGRARQKQVFGKEGQVSYRSSGGLVQKAAMVVARPFKAAVAQSMGNQSPSVHAQQMVTEYVDGLEIGATKNTGDSAKAGKTVGNSFAASVKQSILSGKTAPGLMPAISAKEQYKTSQSAARREAYNIKEMQRIGMSDAQITRQLERLKISKQRQAQAQERQTKLAQANAQLAQNNANLAQQSNRQMAVEEQARRRGLRTRVSEYFATPVGDGTRTRGQAIRGRIGAAGGGATMGLMGLSMAASMAGGSVGEMAQKIMPVTMGLMGLQMVIPMLTNPIGLAILAIGGLTAGFIYLRKQLDDTAKEAAKMGANIGGVANGMKIIEEATGFKPPSPQDRLFRFTDEDRQAMGEFSSYFESEAGSKFVQELRQASSEERYEKVARLLAQAVGSGLEQEKAKAFGFAIAEATGDALLKSNIARDFANQVFKSGSQALISLEQTRLQETPELTVLGRNQFDPGLLGQIEFEKDVIGDAFSRLNLGEKIADVVLQFVVGGLGGTTFMPFTENQREQDRVESASKGLGFILQTIQNLTNAEAVLEEERKSGLITIDEYTKRSKELNDLQLEASNYIGKIFSLGADAGAMAQALGDQLSFAGFDESQITRITERFNPEELTKQFFGEDVKFEDLTKDQRSYVEQVLTRVLSGLTPENIDQRLEDVEGTYTTIAEKAVQALADGTMAALGGLDQFFSQQNIEDYITQRMGGGISLGTKRGISSQQLASNIMKADQDLKKLGTDAIEVFTRLTEFTDQDFAKGIMSSEEQILKFGEAVTKLAEYESINIEVVMEQGIDPDLIVRTIKKINNMELDPKIFGQFTLNAEKIVASLIDAGIEIKDFPAKLAAGTNAIDAFGKKAVDSLGNIKPEIVPKIVANVFGSQVDNPEEIASALNSAFPDGLTPIDLAILLTLEGDAAAIALLSNPAALAAAAKGEKTFTETVRVDGETFRRERVVPGGLAAVAPFLTGGAQAETERPKDTSGSGGGGEPEKSFLEQTMEDLEANAALYLTTARAAKKYGKAKADFFGIFQELRTKFGVPEGFIASLGTGVEAVQKAIEFMEATKAERKRLIALYRENSVGEGIERLRRLRAERKARTEAITILTANGISLEDAKKVAEDSDLAMQIIEAAATGNKKRLNALLDLIKTEVIPEEEAEDPLDALSDRLSDITDLMGQAFDAAEIEAADKVAATFFSNNTALAEKLAQTTGHTITNGYELVEAMERQVSLNERLINQEQDKIDKKQEEINDYERTNQLIQQGIDDLRRNDEIRNRTSESLSKDLEEISKAEEKIREKYQKRIDALDKVSQINDHLIQQQQKQLNLSRAISEGDIYAATQAAQEMRAASAQQAAEQTRLGLERGMEAQIESLTNAEGMTRKQIEEEINNIKEQNYQNSLLIRIEEDKIYANSLEIRRLSNEIYDIQENIIEPLQNQNKEYSRMLDYYKQDSDYQISRVTLAGMTREQFEKQANALATSIKNARDLSPELQAIVGDYNAIAAAARNAVNEAQGLGVNMSSFPSFGQAPAISTIDTFGITPDMFGGMDFSNLNLDFSGINLGFGGFNSGGMVLGEGSRDSISAMLTPGEYVIRKAMVNKYGIPLMEALNQGSFAMPTYDTGPEMPEIGAVSMNNISNINAPVYNTYDMKFSISGTSQSADEIANKVMFKMKQVQSQGVRSNRGY